MRVCHEKAKLLEQGLPDITDLNDTIDSHRRLRAVSLDDFKEALKKMKSSVSETSRELQKVVEWNDKYGEVRRKEGKRSRTGTSVFI